MKKRKFVLLLTILAISLVALMGTIGQAAASPTTHDNAIRTLGPPAERYWSDLPEGIVSVPQEEPEEPINYVNYEMDIEKLQELKHELAERSGGISPVIEEDTAAPNVPVHSPPGLLMDFEGLDNRNQPDGFWHRPPDPHIAVGPNHVGVMVNSEFAFYTKDGTLVVETDFATWWSNVYPGPAFDLPFDPRIAYDHHADRWIMMTLAKDDPDSLYLLSVSQTSDPTDGWWNWQLDGSLMYGGDDTWADYPDLGFDGITDGAIYITSNQFTWPAPPIKPKFKTALLNILPKSALYSGSGFSYWRAWGRTNEDGSQAFTLRTAHTFGNPGGEFLINSKSGGWDKVTLWRVNPTFPPTPVDWVRQSTTPIGSYSPPPMAEQKGGTDTIDTIDNRIYNCMYRNGHLYAAFTEAHDWGSGTVTTLRYLKIDTNTNNADLNIRYGKDGYYYFFPAIYTDSSDNIVIVFARSNKDRYVETRYAGRKTTDIETGASALLKLGETYIPADPGPPPETVSRWGDYFGIANDPVCGSRVWIYGEWAKNCPFVDSDWDWGTWIGEVSFTPNQPPVADANGPYISSLGSTILFDASGSYDLCDEPLLYEWDLDNDGMFDDIITPSPTYSYTWSGQMIGVGGTIALRVTDLLGASSTATAQITLFGVELTLSPTSLDIVPGDIGTYTITVTNKGNVLDTFDLSLSGLPASWWYEFSSNPVIIDAFHWTWVYLSIKPYKDCSTTPGDYSFTVTATSQQAPLYGLTATDSVIGNVHVMPYHEVEISLTPAFISVEPGESAFYTIGVHNLGNVVDTFTLSLSFDDFGTLYRAFPTAIQSAWTSIVPPTLTVNPCHWAYATLTITVPVDWAGMEDATYTFDAIATSQADPTAQDTASASLQVEATKRSMAEYIKLEILWKKIEKDASSVDPRFKWLADVYLDIASEEMDKAIEDIENGLEVQADCHLSRAKIYLWKFVMLIDSWHRRLPPLLAEEWKNQAEQIIEDINTTIGTPI